MRKHMHAARLGATALIAAGVVLGAWACDSADEPGTPIPVASFDSSTSGFDAAVPKDSSVADSPADSADTSTDSPVDSPVDAPVDAGRALNGCHEYDFADADYTAADASRIIRFPEDASPAAYDPRCMHIKVGESVRWVGSFYSHPLLPAGGDPNNPIPEVLDAGPDGSFTLEFPEAGWFGYQCEIHSSMQGAVEVTP